MHQSLQYLQKLRVPDCLKKDVAEETEIFLIPRSPNPEGSKKQLKISITHPSTCFQGLSDLSTPLREAIARKKCSFFGHCSKSL